MDFVKWLSTPQAKEAAAATTENALVEFRKPYPNADMSQFTTEVEFDEKINQQEKSISYPDRDGCKIRTRLEKRTGAEPRESPWVSLGIYIIFRGQKLFGVHAIKPGTLGRD